MFRDEALEVVQGYLVDYDPRYLAEDVELDLVSEADPVRGRAAVAGRVHDLRHRICTEVETDVTHLWVSGDSVISEGLITGRRRATGSRDRRFCLRLLLIVTVVDGEIRRARVYSHATTRSHLRIALEPSSASRRAPSPAH